MSLKSVLFAEAEKGWGFLKAKIVEMENPEVRAKIEQELVDDAKMVASWVDGQSKLGRALAAFLTIMSEVEAVDRKVLAPAQAATGIGEASPSPAPAPTPTPA